MRFRCTECKRMVTRGPSGLEYGHERGIGDPEDERCSRRPDGVDPDDPRRPNHVVNQYTRDGGAV